MNKQSTNHGVAANSCDGVFSSLRSALFYCRTHRCYRRGRRRRRPCPYLATLLLLISWNMYVLTKKVALITWLPPSTSPLVSSNHPPLPQEWFDLHFQYRSQRKISVRMPSSLQRRGVSTSSLQQSDRYGGFGFLLDPAEKSRNMLHRQTLDINYQRRPHYNHLQFTSFGKPRVLLNLDDDERRYARERRRALDRMMNQTVAEENIIMEWDRALLYDELDFPKKCQRPQWSYQTYPACNSFHEINIHEPFVDAGPNSNGQHLGFQWKFLGNGYYRQAWRLDELNAPYAPSDTHWSSMVLKIARISGDRCEFDKYAMHQGQVEALTMLATQSSPLVSNLYGFCATSMMSELGIPIEDFIIPDGGYLYAQEKLDRKQQKDVYPMNALTNEQKLYLALTMAESLAEIHGHPGGVIVNDDIQASQWIINYDGALKLNDFNNVRIMEFDVVKNEYCPFESKFEWTNRPPEELKYNRKADEKADVYALGNVFYSILTGLTPYYQKSSWSNATQAIVDGELPFIDPRYRTRSMIERRLVEIMEACWAYYPQDRISVFEVVAHLRETVRIYEEGQDRTVNRNEIFHAITKLSWKNEFNE